MPADMTPEEQEYWRKRADFAYRQLTQDPTLNGYEVLAAIVWPTPEMEAALELL